MQGIQHGNLTADLKEIPDAYTSDTEEFPSAGFERLRSLGLMSLNVPLAFGGRGIGNGSHNALLLQTLMSIGAYDLSLGRIYEGHINALLLMESFGTHEQKAHYFSEALSGKLFGIWNSELPTERLKYKSTTQGYEFEGAKIFCSGASQVHRPIVTAEGRDGSRMVILHLDEYRMTEDYSYWKPLGMISSVSCRFDFTHKAFREKQFLGNSYDYVREPDFSGGSVRFAAVQLGGAEAAVRATVRHLDTMGRTEAQEQRQRLGKLSILMETGRLWLKGAGKAMDDKHKNPEEYVHYSNMVRTVIRDICEEVLNVCGMSVGLQGMMKSHPLERIQRDLSVYLKQPGPDRALSETGRVFSKTYTQL